MGNVISAAVTLKRALKDFLQDFEGIVRVETRLAPKGPEVWVLVRRQQMKRIRLLLPVEKHGIPVIVSVEKP